MKKYIAGIDGLRSLAVFLVLLYHVDESWIPGGFVGVDVFFVISGFLITRLIVDELETTQKFKFVDFYKRRIKRLFPALFFTICVSFLFAFLLFTPERLIDFSGEVISSLFSISNFYFWKKSGYFDAESLSKPLLHTWSLSVEEQFYLFWPAILVLCYKLYRRRGVLLALSVVAFISFSANFFILFGKSFFSPEATLISGSSSIIFFLTPFRIFEFAIGASLLWIMPLPQIRTFKEISVLSGLVLILFSALRFNENTLFPYINAFYPCIGAALIIYGADAKYLGSIFRNKIAVYMGLISYSTYLAHWPIIVFYRYWSESPINLFEKIILVISSITIGALMYRYVETPFRNPLVPFNHRCIRTVPLWIMCSLFLIILSLNVYLGDGWNWRLDKNASQMTQDNPIDSIELQGRLGCSIFCDFGNERGRKILLIGDSHSDQYSKSLKNLGSADYQFYQVYAPSCFFGSKITLESSPSLFPECLLAKKKLSELLNRYKFDGVIIAQRWVGYANMKIHEKKQRSPTELNLLFFKLLDESIGLFKDFKGPIVIVGHVPNADLDCYKRPTFIPISCKTNSKREREIFNETYKKISLESTLDIRLVDPSLTLCPSNLCKLYDDRKMILYSDTIHLSIYGANLIVPQILKNFR